MRPRSIQRAREDAEAEDKAQREARCNVVPGLRSYIVPIETLRADQKNPRRHGEESVDAIAASLKAHGQHRAAVFVRGSRIVVVGNGMLAAAELLGWTHIAAVEVLEDEVRARARGIADNRAAELAAWDWPALERALEVARKVPPARKRQAIERDPFAEPAPKSPREPPADDPDVPGFVVECAEGREDAAIEALREAIPGFSGEVRFVRLGCSVGSSGVKLRRPGG